MARFHVASEERSFGATTDIYFQRTEEVLRRHGRGDRHAYAEVTTGSLPEAWVGAVWPRRGAGPAGGPGGDVEASGRHPLPGARPQWRAPAGPRSPPYGAYCVYETPLLGFLARPPAATRSARVTLAAGGLPVLSFGIRRMHPAIAPVLDRAAWVGGCTGVSCVLCAERLGIEATGTMPHALMILFSDQATAWRAYH